MPRRSGNKTRPLEHHARVGADRHGYVDRHLMMTRKEMDFSSSVNDRKVPESVVVETDR